MSNATSLKRPGPDQPLDGVNVAQLVAVSLRLAMEVSVLRDRLRTHEALLAKHGLLDAAAVDAYAATPEESRERDTFKRELIEALAADIDPKAG
jgi:hypothetical protein